MDGRSWLGKVAQVDEDGDEVVLGVSFNEDILRELRVAKHQLGEDLPRRGQLFEVRAGAEPDINRAKTLSFNIATRIPIAC
ncbi:hypothetical protein C4544_04440 [candidate division WS5 bacterium]|uniref:Uncharacterized protein n=1 Tax=candidate division WS5 bacterium TaxID=2093353 RepID=A0A419DC91_9BACT|nr:MAG: hypothetical protein C4544_04440 [candidate division WS5 bacterium]